MNLNYRVGKTSGAAHVAREFGYDLGQYGNLTPELVHDAARQAKVTDLQKQLATALSRHVAKIRANKVEIERLTLEAIEGGLTDKAQIDKYVNQAIIAEAKHDSHLVNLQQKVQNELNLVKVQGASTQTLQNMDFRQRLLLIKASHNAKGQIQTNGFQQSLRAIQASPQQALAMQTKRSAFNNYINAKDFDPIPAVTSNSGGNSPIANTGKGFLGGLFDFFTGKN
jgi:phage baseplate assembly protein W